MKREPGNNALEVIRKSDHRLVGWITSIDASRLKRRQAFPFSLRVDGPPVDGLEPVQNFTFMIDTTSITVSRRDIDESSKENIEHEIAKHSPHYAAPGIAMMSDQTIFSWFALCLEDDQIEVVFDHPNFMPA